MINDYASLQTAIGNWTARTDLPVTDFITLAESRINRDLRIRAMETTATLTTTAGNNSVSLPTGYLQARRLIIQNEPPFDLNYRTPSQFYSLFDPSVTDRPVDFSIEGNNLLLGPTPDGIYTLSMELYQALPALSTGANWLITNAPDVYLFASLTEAFMFLMDEQRASFWDKRYAEAVKAVQDADRKDRFSGGPLTVQPDVRLERGRW